MKVLTQTSYKKHNDLYIKIQGSIAVNGCQVGLAQRIPFYCQKPL